MTDWTALIPFKPPGQRKTRLGERLSDPERDAIAERMFEHVVATLIEAPRIARVLLLCAERPASWRGAWRRDESRGLNAELAAAYDALARVPILIVHADLPLLTPADIAALASAGDGGWAIAPDRHGHGTNALAIGHGGPFAFRFGVDSFTRHRADNLGTVVIVERSGLMIDVDGPLDLDLASREGFLSP